MNIIEKIVWGTFILIIILIIWVWIYVEVQANTIIAKCPETGFVFLEVEPYYATYKKDSPEYWNAYCNQMKNTKFECK